ncbi:uncharacterized protein LOC135393203 [Ornithodoros turicata]|uniref:uncharacterized protein LOC135393203 n=1 Tax=Ornithodoros turicata TaxID=34597 RepID=UPI003138ECA6
MSQDQAATRAFNAGYFSQTVGSIRSLYADKIEMCNGVDPCELREGVDVRTDVNLLPDVSYEDIVNYLVLATSSVTLEQMKAYTSLESHNYFTSGWVSGLSTTRPAYDRCLILSKVNHSQRLRDVPLKVWILCRDSGEVLTAHCTCMAGAGETCSHVGATLFATEAHVRIRKNTTCTGKENSWLPPSMKSVEYKKIRDIDFSSSKTKMRKVDQILQDHNESPSSNKFELQHAERSAVNSPAASELDAFYNALQAANCTPTIFSVLPGYNSGFRTIQAREPVNLRTLYDESALCASLAELKQKAEAFMLTFTVTEHMVTHCGVLDKKTSSVLKMVYVQGRADNCVNGKACGLIKCVEPIGKPTKAYLLSRTKPVSCSKYTVGSGP